MKTRRGDNSTFSIFNFTLLVALCAAVGGCFDEPEPAYKSVPAECRVYLDGKALKSVDWADAAFAAGERIDYLNLDRNQLESVDGVERLVGLKWLRLNGNRLTKLPDLRALVSLRRIYLRDNRFDSVPDTLKDLPSLTDIELSGNPIKEIPSWLLEKKGLKNLSFNRTRITALPPDLSAWSSLQSLQLGELSLPDVEMARIRKALPNVTIVF